MRESELVMRNVVFVGMAERTVIEERIGVGAAVTIALRGLISVTAVQRIAHEAPHFEGALERRRFAWRATWI